MWAKVAGGESWSGTEVLAAAKLEGENVMEGGSEWCEDRVYSRFVSDLASFPLPSCLLGLPTVAKQLISSVSDSSLFCRAG